MGQTKSQAHANNVLFFVKQKAQPGNFQESPPPDFKYQESPQPNQSGHFQEFSGIPAPPPTLQPNKPSSQARVQPSGLDGHLAGPLHREVVVVHGGPPAAAGGAVADLVVHEGEGGHASHPTRVITRN